MNIGAFIEKIKTGLQKILRGKIAEQSPATKNLKGRKPAGAPAPKKNDKKIPSAAKTQKLKKEPQKRKPGATASKSKTAKA